MYRSAAIAVAVGGTIAGSDAANAAIVAYTTNQALPATVYFNSALQFTFNVGPDNSIVAAAGNLIAPDAPSGSTTAAKLGYGTAINAALFTGASGTLTEFTVKTSPYYVGLNVNDGPGVDYYGWAEVVNSTGSTGYPTDLVAYAFETTPNTPINAGELAPLPAPEPASLVLLASGVAGVAAIRRRRKSVRA